MIVRAYDIEAMTAQLIEHEGLRLKPYRCPAGKLTIGIGRNLDDRGISEQEAAVLCRNDIDGAERDLDRNVPWWRELSAVRQMALVDMCLNLGWPRLSGFKRMLAALERTDYETAADEMLDSKWARQVGVRAVRIADMIRSGTNV